MLRHFEGLLRATGGKRSPPLSRITAHMSDPYFSREVTLAKFGGIHDENSPKPG